MSTNYYQPSEYEQMLIASGWVSIEILDINYQSYLQRCHRHDVDEMSYQQWVDTEKELVALSEQFSELETKYGIGTVWDSAPEETKAICDKMAELESYLVL